MLPPLVDPGPSLDRAETQRYARHLLVPALGDAGQRRLRAAKVLVMGAGGLGSPALLYLAAAGVGTITVVDDDVVEVSNLQRQVIHSEAALGTPKVTSVASRLRSLNPGVEVVQVGLRLTSDNALDILRGHHVVLDGTDNFPTRYVVNDACRQLGIPLVWASLFRTEAQLSVFWKNPPGDAVGVDLRDLFPTPPDPASVPSCGDAGVVGALCGQVGSVMAAEAIKLICGIGEPLLGRILYVDLLGARSVELPLRPRNEPDAAPALEPELESCATGARARNPEPAASRPAPTGRRHPKVGTVSPHELAAALRSDHPPVVLDVREPGEVAIVAIPGTLRVPLQSLLDDPPHFPPYADVVVHCKTGPRAERAAAALAASGCRVRTLTGGMLAWIDEIDPDLPRY